MRKFLLAVSVLVFAMISCAESTPTPRPTPRPTKAPTKVEAQNNTCLDMDTVYEFYEYAYGKSLSLKLNAEGHDYGYRDLNDGHAIGVNINSLGCVNQITVQVITDYGADTSEMEYLVMPALMYQNDDSLTNEHSEFVAPNVLLCETHDVEESMFSAGYTTWFECFKAEGLVVITIGVADELLR